MEKSTFRYKLYNPTGRQKPFSKCSYGIYCKAAQRLKGEHEQNEQEKNEQEEKEYEENEQEENEPEYSECVVMDCGKDICHVQSQIELSSKMGNEYALEVIHMDNTKTSEVKVIYPYFENTLPKWLKELDLPKKTDEYDKWMQDEVFPKIRKLWQMLLEMKDKKITINKPYCIPLINGVPKLLYIHEEDDDGSYKLPKYIEEAQNFWKSNQNSGLLQHYPVLGIHPVLYNSDEKSRFLQLFYDITFESKLSRWLDEEMDWNDFESRMMFAKNKVVYGETLHHCHNPIFTERLNAKIRSQWTVFVKLET
ncbi:hypothetical protein SLEP1_g41346 [Rubroshorea leprosula]|uniref:Uncharacterized protein n=1 Tax=Rubroshorea leprosula TaxID=152421 RepID=A0AAV5L6I5_9ROSI|nr:hypothetical protein SLEP1_g41346 [Rubroshorea leprosula]